MLQTEKFEAAENARLAGEADNEELRQEKEGQEGRLRAMELQVSHLKDVAKESANAARAAQETVVRVWVCGCGVCHAEAWGPTRPRSQANVTDDKLVLAKHIKQMQAKMSTLVREVSGPPHASAACLGIATSQTHRHSSTRSTNPHAKCVTLQSRR